MEKLTKFLSCATDSREIFRFIRVLIFRVSSDVICFCVVFGLMAEVGVFEKWEYLFPSSGSCGFRQRNTRSSW